MKSVVPCEASRFHDVSEHPLLPSARQNLSDSNHLPSPEYIFPFETLGLFPEPTYPNIVQNSSIFVITASRIARVKRSRAEKYSSESSFVDLCRSNPGFCNFKPPDKHSPKKDPSSQSCHPQRFVSRTDGARPRSKQSHVAHSQLRLHHPPSLNPNPH